MSNVAGRLAFPAPSLALRSTRLPAPSLVTTLRGVMPDGADLRGLPLLSTESPSLRTATRRPLLRSPAKLPAAARTGLPVFLSWGWMSQLGYPNCSAFRPSVDRPFGLRSRGHSLHPLPDTALARNAFGLEVPTSRSRSALVVSHHLDGFLCSEARRLIASCCRPWGSSRFNRGRSRLPPSSYHASPRCDLPSKNLSPLPWALRSPGALAPVPFLPSRGRRLRGFFRQSGAVTSYAVASVRSPVLPGLLLPLRGARVGIAAPSGSLLNRSGPTAHHRSP
jgi:hypothetical protein